MLFQWLFDRCVKLQNSNGTWNLQWNIHLMKFQIYNKNQYEFWKLFPKEVIWLEHWTLDVGHWIYCSTLEKLLRFSLRFLMFHIVHCLRWKQKSRTSNGSRSQAESIFPMKRKISNVIILSLPIKITQIHTMYVQSWHILIFP